MLVKGSTSSSVHYLSPTGNVVQIADSLTAYVRLMLLYLGLPDWPLVHLNMELSHWNKVKKKIIIFKKNLFEFFFKIYYSNSTVILCRIYAFQEMMIIWWMWNILQIFSIPAYLKIPIKLPADFVLYWFFITFSLRSCKIYR